MRARKATVLVLALAAVSTAGVAGCGGASQKDLVVQKVTQFQDAVRHRDYHTICGQVLAPALLIRLASGGIACEAAMRLALASVQDPSLSVAKVIVQGSRATVVSLTSAKGQLASLDAIELVKTSAGWRVSSLGSPVAAGK